MKFGRVVPGISDKSQTERDRETDRQTERQRDMLITTMRTAVAGAK